MPENLKSINNEEKSIVLFKHMEYLTFKQKVDWIDDLSDERNRSIW
jgi:hypothetical protein